MYVSSYCILLPVSAWSTMLFPNLIFLSQADDKTTEDVQAILR